MVDIVMFGTGQNADIASYYFENDSKFNVVAYTIDKDFITQDTFRNKPVIAFEGIEDHYPNDRFKMFVALGYQDLNKKREEKFLQVKAKGYQCVTYINSNAGLTGPISIGENCFIMENQMIQAYSKIENNVFLWSGTLVAHHSIIKNHCWITSGASIAGNSQIGERCFIGINSTVGHFVKVGDDSFIGANSLVTKDAKDKSVFIQPDTKVYALDSDKFWTLAGLK